MELEKFQPYILGKSIFVLRNFNVPNSCLGSSLTLFKELAKRESIKRLADRAKAVFEEEAKEREKRHISDEGATRYSSILIECCYRRL